MKKIIHIRENHFYLYDDGSRSEYQGKYKILTSLCGFEQAASYEGSKHEITFEYNFKSADLIVYEQCQECMGHAATAQKALIKYQEQRDARNAPTGETRTLWNYIKSLFSLEI